MTPRIPDNPTVNAGDGLIALRSVALAGVTEGRRVALQSLAKAAPATITEYASGLSQPIALAFNQNGELFVANQGNSQISKVPPGGGSGSTCPPPPRLPG